MIRVRLFGNLGNQMFQYAFAKKVSEKMSARFWFSTRHVRYALHYFELPFPLNLLNNRWLRAVNNKTEGWWKFKHTKDYSSPLQDASQYMYSDRTDYLGYFQDSSLYKNKAAVRALFPIRKAYRREFEEKYAAVMRQHKVITVSVRLGDYRKERLRELNNAEVLLPLEWYKKQLSEFNLNDYKVFITSDEPDTCQKEFAGFHPHIQIVRDHFITQLMILMHSDVCIISNSTFAWWGAYLNAKDNVQVIAPNNWMGYRAGTEYPKGIMNIDFAWVD